MAFEVFMPRLGWTMESGKLVEWLKKDGDAVQNGEMIFSVEGDKAVQEVEALDSGILRILPHGPKLGEDVLVGTLLAYICQPDEKLPFEQQPAQAEDTTAQAEPPSATQVVAQGATRNSTNSLASNVTISPRARRVAQELSVDWTSVAGTGITGRIREKDIRTAALAQQKKELPVTPVARRVAADLGVDLNAFSKNGKLDRITRADVEAMAQKAAPVASEDSLQAVPMGRLRHLIAERMSASAQTTAPVTLTTEVDASALYQLRKDWKSDAALSDQILPSYSDMLIKLVTQALTEFPIMNAHLDGETIVYQADCQIGLAVDTEDGLIAPVIRHAQTLGLKQIAAQSSALIQKARQGKLTMNDLGGSTFTLTNLGMFDIDAFTPIINLPECAILGVGRMVPKVVVIDEETEETAVRRMMFLSLTFDHRIVDGAPAAKFLKRIKQLIEKPNFWLY